MPFAKQGHHLAVAELIKQFKAINGATGGFWNDLDGRVFNQLWVPEDSGSPKKPYLCVVTAGDAASFADDDDTVFCVWTLQIFGFVNESTSSRADSDAQERIYKLQDDVIKAHLADRKLSGTVEATNFISATRNAGIFPTAGRGERYGELQMALELRMIVDAACLGPE